MSRGGIFQVDEEMRSFGSIELRSMPGNLTQPGTVTGYAVKWDLPSSPLQSKAGDRFVEVFKKGAFAESLYTSDVLAVLDHHEGASSVLGRTPATLRVWEDDIGLRFENALPDTQAGRNLAASIRRGDVKGVSMAFWPSTSGVAWQDATGPLPRRIISSAKLKHVAYVTRPAYPDTSIALRSLDEARKGADPGQRRRDLIASQHRTARAMLSDAENGRPPDTKLKGQMAEIRRELSDLEGRK